MTDERMRSAPAPGDPTAGRSADDRPAADRSAVAEGAGPVDAGSAAVPEVEAPSDDIVVAPANAGLPGEHRGGFQRELTQPTPITQPVRTDQAPRPELRWAPAPQPLPTSGGWALGLSVVALALSLVVGWAFPLGLASALLAVLALRRPWESRAVAVWALALAALSLVYSALWLVWAAHVAGLLG